MAITVTPQKPLQWECPACKTVGTAETGDLKMPAKVPPYVDRSGVPTQVPEFTPPPTHAGFACPTCGTYLHHAHFKFPQDVPPVPAEVTIREVLDFVGKNHPNIPGYSKNPAPATATHMPAFPLGAPPPPPGCSIISSSSPVESP